MRLLKNRGFWFGAATLAFCFLVWLVAKGDDHYREGLLAAQGDLKRGKLGVALRDGESIPAFWQYNELLRKRYGIRLVVYSLPADPEAVTNWVNEYNGIMVPEIHRRFGTNVLHQTMSDAKTMITNTGKNRR